MHTFASFASESCLYPEFLGMSTASLSNAAEEERFSDNCDAIGSDCE